MIRENIVRFLSLSNRGCAAQRIYIPKSHIRGKVLDTDFARHRGSRLAAPHDAELRLVSLIQHIENVSGSQLSVDAL